jgi:hypothetical protein
MRAILIVVGMAALAYWAYSYWYHGIYFTAFRNMLSQILAQFDDGPKTKPRAHRVAGLSSQRSSDSSWEVQRSFG